MQVIINADDFGIGSSVNEAICECFDRGFITGTTLMVNMPGASEAAERAARGGFESRVGLHLNLTAGKPLTSGIARLPLFCTDGEYNAAFHLSTATRLRMGRDLIAALESELEAQLGSYGSMGFTQGHVDSHHHVHTDRPVWLALKGLARRHSVTSVRIGRNLYGMERPSLFNRLYKSWLNGSMASAGLGGTDLFGSFEDFRQAMEAGFFDKRPEATAEIMVHPMYDEDGRLVDTDIPMEEENELLLSWGCSRISY